MLADVYVADNPEPPYHETSLVHRVHERPCWGAVDAGAENEAVDGGNTVQGARCRVLGSVGKI